MRSHWFSIVTLVAALMIGYSILSSREGAGLGGANEPPVIMGYYLRDAIITETADDGTPRARFAASQVNQEPDLNRVVMTSVRADYLWPAKNGVETAPSSQHPANHWVLNADAAYLPTPPSAPDEQESEAAELPTTRTVELRGNVEAYNVGAEHDAVLKTEALDIDTDRELANTKDAVTVDIDGHAARGTGLNVDLKHTHVRLLADVSLRLATTTQRRAPQETPTADQPPSLSLPELFESESFDYQDNVLTLTKVRSTTEPFISADLARATGADLANNQVILRGNVRMELPKRGLIEADAAKIGVRNSRVVYAEATGSPVRFQHQDKDDGRIVHGRANIIDYDVQTQMLRFMNDAWFNNNQFEIKSDLIEYNLATEAARGTRIEGAVLRDNAPARPPQQ